MFSGPTSIEEFSKVAPYLTNPLVLVGFVLWLVFEIYKVLIKSGILTPVSKATSGKIVRLILNQGFIIIVALLFILSGLGQATWKSRQQKTGNATTTGAQSPAVTGTGNQFNYDKPSQPEQRTNPPK
ncbi:MAG: hypothetical protein ABSA29_05175 [Terriglobales bacterium]